MNPIEQAFDARCVHTQRQNGSAPPLSPSTATIPPPPVYSIRQAHNTPYNESITSKPRSQTDATTPSLEENPSIKDSRPYFTEKPQLVHRKRAREDFNKYARTNAARQTVEQAGQAAADEQPIITNQNRTRPGPANYVPIFVRSMNGRRRELQTPLPENPYTPQSSLFQTVNPKLIALSNDPHNPYPTPPPTPPRRRKFTSLNPKTRSRQNEEPEKDQDHIFDDITAFPLPRTGDPCEAQAQIVGYMSRVKARMMKAPDSRTQAQTQTQTNKRKRVDETDDNAQAVTDVAHADGSIEDAAEEIDYIEDGLVSLLGAEESFFDAACHGRITFLG